MRVLVVEDDAFNAFCLQRVLQLAFLDCQVELAHNSAIALQHLSHTSYDLLVLDGDLGVMEEDKLCNGPALLDKLWQEKPRQKAVAWSDSSRMLQEFRSVFHRHGREFTQSCCWPKTITAQKIVNLAACA